MNPSRTITVILFAALTFAGVRSGYAAAYVDTFANTSNLTLFGSGTLSVASNTLTAARTAASVDTGFDWQPGGAPNKFSLLAGDGQFVFQLTAVSTPNGGFYNINALVFDSGGTFVSEISVQTDTNATGTFSYNIASLSSGNPTAQQWFPRVRVLPTSSSDAAFDFQDFEAIPEPSTLALLAFAGVFGAAALRRRLLDSPNS